MRHCLYHSYPPLNHSLHERCLTSRLIVDGTNVIGGTERRGSYPELCTYKLEPLRLHRLFSSRVCVVVHPQHSSATTHFLSPTSSPHQPLQNELGKRGHSISIETGSSAGVVLSFCCFIFGWSVKQASSPPEWYFVTSLVKREFGPILARPVSWFFLEAAEVFEILEGMSCEIFVNQ